jgi:hypothetical protein
MLRRHPLGHIRPDRLAACEAAKVLRPGLDPADVMLLMGFLWRVGPGEDGKAQAPGCSISSSTESGRQRSG